jgi:hypothetical protein
MMLQRSCYAELQLDVAKRTVLATRREELGSSIHPSFHPSIHPPIRPSIHSFVRSFTVPLIGSLIR